MHFHRTAALAALLLSTAAPAAASGPSPDPAPEAHGTPATVSGSYWVDVNVYVNDQRVHGAMGRCFYPAHGPIRCFIIRTDVR